MPQKIKIIGLVKTDEYIQKELDAVEASKLKLLRDSDWTQVMDAPLDPLTVLEWRHWRQKIRDVRITLDAIHTAKQELLNLEQKMPPKKSSAKFGSVVTRLDYSSIDSFRESCIMVIKELLPGKSLYAKAFSKKSAKLTTYDEIFFVLMDILKDGY